MASDKSQLLEMGFDEPRVDCTFSPFLLLSFSSRPSALRLFSCPLPVRSLVRLRFVLLSSRLALPSCLVPFLGVFLEGFSEGESLKSD
jgi:hypothetical protein